MRRLCRTTLVWLAATGLVAGCGRRVEPQPAAPPAVTNVTAAPQPVTAPVPATPRAPEVDLVATNLDADAVLAQILELEQNAQFGKALAACATLQGRGLDQKKVEEVRVLMARLREEKATAVNLAFAIDSLETHKDVAARELCNESAVGTLLLRQAVRERDGNVLVNAASLLASMSDTGTPVLLVARLRTCTDTKVAAALIDDLDQLKEVVDPALTPALLDAVRNVESGASLLAVQSLLATVAGKASDTNLVAGLYRQAQEGPGFSNRFAVAFLGMVRQRCYKGNAKAFDQAIGEPGASTNLAACMTALAARRDPNDTDFMMANAVNFPQAIAAFEKTIPLTRWGDPNANISGFQSTPDGHIVGTITGNDPYFHSADNLNISLASNRTLKVTFRNGSEGKTARMFFTKTDDPGIDEDKVVAFAIKPNDRRFTDYVVDMASHPKWKGTLKQLRFDIVDDASSGTFDVTRVVLSDLPAARP